MDFLGEVEKKLDLPPGEKAEVIRELRSHYDEIKAELIELGMDADLAAREASRKLGDPADVVQRMQTVHCRATWKTALLTALPPFVAVVTSLARFALNSNLHNPSRHALYVSLLVLPALSGIIFLGGSTRELVRNRRPIWLATWLAVGFKQSGLVLYLLHEWTIVAGRPLPQTGALAWYSLAVAATGLFAMFIFRRSTRWFLILGGWTVLIEVIYITVPWGSLPFGWSLAFTNLAHAPLLMAIALGLFARHPYGSAAQASLFLFTLLSASYALVVVYNLPSRLVVAATVLAYARACSSRQRSAILAMGIVAEYLALMIFGNSTYQTLHAVFMPFFVVLVPMLFERRWSERRPEIVR